MTNICGHFFTTTFRPSTTSAEIIAPTLLIHGTEDRWVPLEQSLRLNRALDEAGVSHRLLVVPGPGMGLSSR